MIYTKGQIHGVAADPRMGDYREPHGLSAVIPGLNRLAQHHDRYRQWVQDQYGEDGELVGSFEEFDSARCDWWSDLYDSADEVVQNWLMARGSNPIGQ